MGKCCLRNKGNLASNSEKEIKKQKIRKGSKGKSFPLLGRKRMRKMAAIHKQEKGKDKNGRKYSFKGR